MPWVPCQVVSGGQHRRTQLGLCCSQVSLRHGCQLSEVAFDVYSMCLCRHHHRGPGNAETASLTPLPPATGEGADATPCPKKAVITGRMGDCYISTRLPKPGFQRVPAGSGYTRSKRVTKSGLGLNQTHLNIRSGQMNKAIDFFCGVFKRSREEWVYTCKPLQNFFLEINTLERKEKQKTIDCLKWFWGGISKDKILQLLWNMFPNVFGCVSWLSKCGKRSGDRRTH